ncbi:adenylate/guanylate cyclase domain-containing protein [Pannonibacter phragmitetus]|uniref:adenylate/guanylate cyclase domain-containing protein n=1 Tax=Pannonibacter phragmitetus TaxID=121719 RepID=UPI000F45BFA8|nr:adenylate/guanylate cyclase domain-containing protein [Pannonibacter phragmitetus]
MSFEAPLAAADIIQWLYGEAVEVQDSQELVRHLGQRLREARIPVDRISTGIALLHPNVRAESALWTSDGQTELRRYMEAPDLQASYDRSPLKVVYVEGRSVRIRVTPEPEEGEYGILPELRDGGFKDYIAMPLPFSDGTNKALTLATRSEAGFMPAHLAVFESIARPLGLICELNTLRRTASTLLDTYVGPRAGSRVLQGSIKRGGGELISAVISFADLRGFTTLSNRLPGEKLIELLNTYFGAMASAVEAHGGEVLKFIGDEVMAIFPYESADEAQEASRRAVFAAQEAVMRIAEVNHNCCAENPEIKVGIALHAGDVFFGNVGSETRLDFTVVGPAVNLASRIAGLAKALDREILASEAVAGMLGCQSGKVGTYYVKGFDEPVSVFSPPLGGSPCASPCSDAMTAVRAFDAN